MNDFLVLNFIIQLYYYRPQMPPVVNRRGRPKGHTLNVCGLPAKKGRGTKKPISFRLMHPSQEEKCAYNKVAVS